MTEVRLKIALSYKVSRLSRYIDDDIKLIKKLNQVFQRFERFEKEIYILEAVNILKQLDNICDMNELYIVLCEYIDVRFHSTLVLLLNKLDNFDKNDRIKLKDLVPDED